MNRTYTVISFLNEFMPRGNPFKGSEIRRENTRVPNCRDRIDLCSISNEHNPMIKNSLVVHTGDRLASMYLNAPSVRARTPTKHKPRKVKSRSSREDRICNELLNIRDSEAGAEEGIILKQPSTAWNLSCL